MGDDFRQKTSYDAFTHVNADVNTASSTHASMNESGDGYRVRKQGAYIYIYICHIYETADMYYDTGTSRTHYLAQPSRG